MLERDKEELVWNITIRFYNDKEKLAEIDSIHDYLKDYKREIINLGKEIQHKYEFSNTIEKQYEGYYKELILELHKEIEWQIQ